MLFPIHAPRDLTASPSFVMCMRLFNWDWSSGLILHVATMIYLWSSIPIRMISVFSMLNFAPDASHHSSSIGSILSNLSLSLRYRVVSSMNILTVSFSFSPEMARPCISGSFQGYFSLFRGG